MLTTMGMRATRGHPLLKEQEAQATTSASIIDTAKHQELTPWEQKLANLYDPTNPEREKYLRVKY